jgi:hypothetical protein
MNRGFFFVLLDLPCDFAGQSDLLGILICYRGQDHAG